MAQEQSGIRLKDGTVVSKTVFDTTYDDIAELLKDVYDIVDSATKDRRQPPEGPLNIHYALNALEEFCKTGKEIDSEHRDILEDIGLLDSNCHPNALVVEIFQSHIFMASLMNTSEDKNARDVIITFCKKGRCDLEGLRTQLGEAGITKETGILKAVKDRFSSDGILLTDVFAEVARLAEPSQVVGDAYAELGLSGPDKGLPQRWRLN